MSKTRCAWVTNDPLCIDYHDNEWGVPIYDDRLLFEFLILEGAQAGLNWMTILKKREHYRKVFDHFNPEQIAQYGDKKINTLLADPGIIRNRLKIFAAITNANAFLEIQKSGSFSDYLWHFTANKSIINQWKSASDIPTTTPISDQLSQDLKKRGFKFVGSTICYAFMQAVGMVDDHTMNCFKKH